MEDSVQAEELDEECDLWMGKVGRKKEGRKDELGVVKSVSENNRVGVRYIDILHFHAFLSYQVSSILTRKWIIIIIIITTINHRGTAP